MARVLEVREQATVLSPVGRVTEEGFEAMEQYDEFKKVMMVVGISRPTILLMIQRKFFSDLEKFNRREYRMPLSKSSVTFRVSDEELKLLNLFREYYTSLQANERLSLFENFDAAVWQDFKDRSYDNKRKTCWFGAGVVLILVLWLAFVLRITRTQRISMETSLALLNSQCITNSGARIPVNCDLIQCICCYQREKNYGGWVASSTKC